MADGRRGGAPRLALALAALALASPAPAAGVSLDEPSFYERIHAADLVVWGRVLEPEGSVPLAAEGIDWPTVTLEVLQVLKGEPISGSLRFARDGYEIPMYTRGQETIVFLRRIERHPALAGSAVGRTVRYIGPKPGTPPIILTPASQRAYLNAVRTYANLARAPLADAQMSEFRRLTLDLLRSPHRPLALSAARDIAHADAVDLITKQDLRILRPLVMDARVPIERRVALIAALERRGLLFGPWHWTRLLRTTRGDDLRTVLRAVRDHPSAGVTRELVRLLEDDDVRLATAAARALGTPGNHAAVAPLARILGADDVRLRHAAVHALGTIGTQAARQMLELAAARHRDPTTRRRAETEAIVLGRRHGSTLGALTVPPGTDPRNGGPLPGGVQPTRR